MRDEESVTIAYFANSAEAGMACELLANQGVNATLTGANFGGLEPLPLPGGFSEIRLVVPADEAVRARELYDAFFAVDEQTAFRNEEALNEETKRLNNE